MTLYCQKIFLVLKIGLFIQNLSEKYKKKYKLLNCCTMNIPIRATQNKQRGRMRPAGRQFDMPALERHVLFEWPHHNLYASNCYALISLNFLLSCCLFFKYTMSND